MTPGSENESVAKLPRSRTWAIGLASAFIGVMPSLLAWPLAQVIADSMPAESTYYEPDLWTLLPSGATLLAVGVVTGAVAGATARLSARSGQRVGLVALAGALIVGLIFIFVAPIFVAPLLGTTVLPGLLFQIPTLLASAVVAAVMVRVVSRAGRTAATLALAIAGAATGPWLHALAFTITYDTALETIVNTLLVVVTPALLVGLVVGGLVTPSRHGALTALAALVILALAPWAYSISGLGLNPIAVLWVGRDLGSFASESARLGAWSAYPVAPVVIAGIVALATHALLRRRASRSS